MFFCWFFKTHLVVIDLRSRRQAFRGASSKLLKDFYSMMKIVKRIRNERQTFIPLKLVFL